MSTAPWKRTPRPGLRNYLGEVSATLEECNHRELALGTHGRSGDQWDIWQAVFGPVGADGYPQPIWDKLTGEIDRQVAEYWRENYDLVHILERDWSTLGPKLRGKIHIYVGDMDNYYLNDAVYLAEAFLKSAKDPAYERRGRLRGPGRALLERRPRAAERDLAPALSPDVPAAHRRADPGHGAQGRGHHQLALLIAPGPATLSSRPSGRARAASSSAGRAATPSRAGSPNPFSTEISSPPAMREPPG